MRGERKDVGDHPAVREDLRRVADGVHEGLVEPAFVDDRADLGEERRPRLGEPLAMLATLSRRSTSKSYGRS